MSWRGKAVWGSVSGRSWMSVCHELPPIGAYLDIFYNQFLMDFVYFS
jgi:hypothetical protein